MVRVADAYADLTFRRDDGASLAEHLRTIGRNAGLSAVGITTADPFEETRHDLQDRKRRGLHAGMQFTYRNPDRSTDPRRILPGARSLVVGAWSYRQKDPASVADKSDDRLDHQRGTTRVRPTGEVARYARHDHYADLRVALAEIADHLTAQGWRATVVCDDNALVDRAAAHRAGLGWFGKNSLLLLPGQGSWFVLGSVVTDAPLDTYPSADVLAHGEGCGSCSRCQTACPTGALDEPGVVDARRCLAWLVQAPGSFPVEFRQALGSRIYGCDACQQACPINRRVERADRADRADSAERTASAPGGIGAPDRPQTGVDLLALLSATDDKLLAAHGRWYIPGRDPRYLRRNALVALGNTAEADDPDVVDCLRHWIAAGDPLLAEHARWAATHLGRHDLVAETAETAET